MAEIIERTSSTTKTWEKAAAPGASGRVRQFEAAWTGSKRGKRPDPRTFLPDSPEERVGVLVALLRSEMALKWESGERVTVDFYRENYPELDLDGVVALIYEEFCLREEAGDAPVPQEYEDRFSDLADRLRRVFDIHELVGSGGSTSFREKFAPEVPFPESGQTTGGFRLLEELGRGAFARVFLAEERQLADRPVALKVSRAGSREPQTLARLQHTHIVPVHSYRTDVATGLHLLCMPFFGRTTLEQLLADEQMQKARDGGDVLRALDRLEPNSSRIAPSARSAFASLPFARGMALWGSQMAEALAHAHERGVLHRDIKPSNVLVTADGLPMLLDFNLARDPKTEAGGPSMGGTLAYMSPEHLEAVADGDDGRVDERADIFSLGVLLFETLTGRRPYGVPSGATSVPDALHRAADERRLARPSIRETHPEIPIPLESVVLKCLAVDPKERYARAADLAEDLQAVAHDAALVHAREPVLSRTIRLARRRRWPIVLVGLLGLAWLFLANAVVRAREDQLKTLALLSRWIDEGVSLANQGKFTEARVYLINSAQAATTTADFDKQPPLVEQRDRALDGLKRVNLSIEAVGRATELGAVAERVRSRSGSWGNQAGLITAIDQAMRNYLTQDLAQQDLERLDQTRRSRFKHDFEELLFTRAILAGKEHGAVGPLIEIGRSMALDRRPWDAMLLLKEGKEPAAIEPADVASPIGCMLFGLLEEAQGNVRKGLTWVKRAGRLDPDLPGLAVTLTRLEAASR